MIGIDILEIERLHVPDKHFYQRVFLPSEISYIESKNHSAETVAGLFCCKEAILKALGCGIGNGANFHQVEIYHDELGQPQARVYEKCHELLLEKGKTIFVSITHSAKTAVAVAIIK